MPGPDDTLRFLERRTAESDLNFCPAELSAIELKHLKDAAEAARQANRELATLMKLYLTHREATQHESIMHVQV